MIAPTHQLFDLRCRSAHLTGVAAFVGKHFLFREHDGDCRNALSIAVADRGSNTGNRIIGFRNLDRESLIEGFRRSLRKTCGIDFSPTGWRSPGAALEKLDPFICSQMADQQTSGCGPVQGHSCADTRGNPNGLGPSAIARTSIWSPSRPHSCTASFASRQRSCISCVATLMKSSDRA